jgi:hypothetical protein
LEVLARGCRRRENMKKARSQSRERKRRLTQE